MTVNKPDNSAPGGLQGLKRRSFLAVSGAASLAAAAGWELFASVFEGEDKLDQWEGNQVLHLLPTVDHQRIRLTASLKKTLLDPPVLQVGVKECRGQAACAGGRHWIFDQPGLEPDVRYPLQLRENSGKKLCQPWHLKTFPAIEQPCESFRLLVYTCAGGPDFFVDFRLNPAFLPIRLRRKLLRRAMDLQPDAVIATGDHIYWDRESRKGWGMGNSPMARWKAGLFDPQQAAESLANQRVIENGLGVQIAGLYRNMMRSCPVFFMQDDHDFLNNDEVVDGQPLFPPHDFHRQVALLTQRMYYPELLTGPDLPRRCRTETNTSRYYAALRYGDLFEGLLYSCRSEMNAGSKGFFVPPDIEDWIISRSESSNAKFVTQFPTCPFLWTAGKWGEWYPDQLDASGKLQARPAKPHWRRAWQQQHNRLLAAASSQTKRPALSISGDLHASALGQLTVSNGENYAKNPVVCLLPGTIGTGAPGWPTSFRGVAAAPSRTVEAEEWSPPHEHNGFSVLDFTRESVTVAMYGWHPSQGEAAISTLEPYFVRTIPRDF